MSSLIVAHDLHIMMLEVSLDKVHVPRSSAFEAAVVKQTVVMFRLLDQEWTSMMPQRADYHAYRGTNREDETFEGGRSLVFSVPEATLDRPMEGPLHLQVHVHKELSRYFELEPCQSVGIVLLRVEHLFNGIIGDLLAERENYRHEPKESNREPISRSLKGRFKILDENLRDNGAFLDIYARLSYFGKSIVTKIELADTRDQLFYLGPGASSYYLYCAQETTLKELQSGCWTMRSAPFSSKRTPLSLSCACVANDDVHADHQERTSVRSGLDQHRPMGHDEQPMMSSSGKIITEKSTEAKEIKKGKKDHRGKRESLVEAKGKKKSGRNPEFISADEEEDLSKESGVKDSLPKSVKARKNKKTLNKETDYEKIGGTPSLEVRNKLDDKKKATAKSIGKLHGSPSSGLLTESTENKNDTEYTEGNSVNPLKGHRTTEATRKKDTGESRDRGRSLHRRTGAGTAVTGATIPKGRASTCHDATSLESHQPFCGYLQPELCHPCYPCHPCHPCHPWENYCAYYPNARSHLTSWPRLCLRTGDCELLRNHGVYTC